jgi:hypothetical protein
MTEAEKAKAFGIMRAMLETVVEAGDQGAPAGPMYMAWMAQGGTFATFETVMALLVHAKLVVKRGQVYYPLIKELKPVVRTQI